MSRNEPNPRSVQAPPLAERRTTFTVATFNVENYLDGTSPKGRPKSADAKAKVRESIREMNPDVLALQEMGSLAALMELRDSLAAEGIEFPHWEHVTGADADLHIAVLSKFPFAATHQHVEESFILNDRRFQVRRGFSEVEFRLSPSFSFTLLTAHLKSRNSTPEADASQQRLEEARLLRRRIDALLHGEAKKNLVVLGDFNDTPESDVVKTIIGQGYAQLVDTCPKGGDQPDVSSNNSQLRSDARTWTNFYREKGEHSRFDYVLLSLPMARHWNKSLSYVLAMPGGEMASDHRPVLVSFSVRTRIRPGKELENRLLAAEIGTEEGEGGAD